MHCSKSVKSCLLHVGQRLRTLYAGFVALMIVALLGIGVAGCDTDDWAKFSKDKNNVNVIRKGWGQNQVLTKIGRPESLRKGNDLGAGWEEWVYPTGSVVFYRMEVVAVQVRPEDKPLEKLPGKENPEDILMKKRELKSSSMEGFVHDEE